MENLYDYIIKTLVIIAIIQAEIGLSWIFYRIYKEKKEEEIDELYREKALKEINQIYEEIEEIKNGK